MRTLVLLAALTTADPVPPLAPIEAAVLTAREAIRDAHLVVEIDSKGLQRGAVRTRYRFETWFEPGRQRTDITPLDEGTRNAPGMLPWDRVLCRNCPEPGTNLTYGRLATRVEIDKPGGRTAAGTDKSGWMLVVRRLGLSLADACTLDQHPPEKTVGVSRLPEFTQSDEEVGGRRLVKLRGRMSHGPYTTVWIDPSRGPALTRLEIAGKRHNPKLGDVRTVMEVEPARDEVSGVWYFRSCKSTMDLGGGVAGDETITVRTMELNRGLDPAVFTMAGLGIPAGTPVRSGDKPTAPEATWDGRKLVGRAEFEKSPMYQAALAQAGGLPPTPAGPVQAAPEPASPVPSAGPSRWQLVVAAALALAGALSLVRFVRRR